MMRCWFFFLFTSLLTNCFANDSNANGELSINSKIVGGNEAKPGEFPYIVSVQCSIDGGNSFYHCCGGSIYNEITILTHEKCAAKFPYLRIVAGEHNLYIDDKTEQVRSPDTLKTLADAFDERIAILKLAEPLIFNEYVQPIVLPESGSIPEEDTNCTVAGWGTISGNDTVTYPIPRKVSVSTVSYDTCKNSSSSNSGGLCTEHTGGVGICEYDMGNPLVVNNQHNIRTNLQIGIAAYGIGGCGIPENYDVYIRLSAYTDWIRANNPYPPPTTLAPPTTSGAEFRSVTSLKILMIVGIFILFF